MSLVFNYLCYLTRQADISAATTVGIGTDPDHKLTGTTYLVCSRSLVLSVVSVDDIKELR